MNIYLQNPSLHWGPYSTNQIKSAFLSGEVKPADRVWHKPLSEWVSITDFLNGAENESAEADSDPGWVWNIPSAIVPVGGISYFFPSQHFYRRLQDTFNVLITRLSTPFDEMLEKCAEGRKIEVRQVVDAFFGRAAEFNEQCSTACGLALRQFSDCESIRAAPAERVCQEVRDEAFASLDEILLRYREVVSSGSAEQVKTWFSAYLEELAKLPGRLVGFASRRCMAENEMKRSQVAECLGMCAECCKTFISRTVNVIDQFERKERAAYTRLYSR